jgi:hypothetical protein
VICLALRAREDSVRPRRLSGASGRRPLNFTVRRPFVMPRRSVCRLTVWLLLLQGCAAPHTPALSGAESGHDLLRKLRQCLADVPARGDLNYASPCAHIDVASLSGLTVAQLKAALGPPGISSDDYVCASNKPSAPLPPYECRWAFYRLPADVLGVGPELQCLSEDRVTCKKVGWVLTQ